MGAEMQCNVRYKSGNSNLLYIKVIIECLMDVEC